MRALWHDWLLCFFICKLETRVSFSISETCYFFPLYFCVLVLLQNEKPWTHWYRNFFHLCFKIDLHCWCMSLCVFLTDPCCGISPSIPPFLQPSSVCVFLMLLLTHKKEKNLNYTPNSSFQSLLQTGYEQHSEFDIFVDDQQSYKTNSPVVAWQLTL